MQMKAEEKIPGGKLLYIDVDLSEGKISKIRITGDFFLHPEDTIAKIEKGLEGVEPNHVASKVSEILAENGAQFIGVSQGDIERLVKKAVS